MFSKKAWLFRHAFFIAALCFTSNVFALCNYPNKTLNTLEQQYVSRVIDGDTLVLKNQEHVRLIGVNTPEKGQALANKARSLLSQLTLNKAVFIEQGVQARDRYGRLLANLYLADGRSVEAEILHQGLGFAVAIPPNVQHVDCLFQTSQYAKQHNLGVWSFYAAKKSTTLTENDIGFQRIEGTLTSLSASGKTLWLQLDGPIVLRIAAKDAVYFNPSQLQQWLGKTIEVTGWTVLRKPSKNTAKIPKNAAPLMLLLTHPAHIQLTSH